MWSDPPATIRGDRRGDCRAAQVQEYATLLFEVSDRGFDIAPLADLCECHSDLVVGANDLVFLRKPQAQALSEREHLTEPVTDA